MFHTASLLKDNFVNFKKVARTFKFKKYKRADRPVNLGFNNLEHQLQRKEFCLSKVEGIHCNLRILYHQAL